ncbi:polysaccharide deacetylase family protein [Tissierella sp.]|uniref:polysaccharide deacetylase family protein n=1 Tax=Tissierella sp. TaxID=41274 RepID=UPI0028637EF2|nr:polysaccharide deacetylase family protein [Tissierella sp.]MDR7855966.1 polysaccharide deacetylase family protein [Tissierella sp.]
MIKIKIKIKIVLLSFIVAILMYPRTITFLINSIKDFYIARNLSLNAIQSHSPTIDTDKTRILFIFDDGWKSVYSEAYDVMKEYGYKGSVCIIPSLTVEKEYISYRELAELYLDGWDLLNHSYSHKVNLYQNTDELLSDFNRARRWMDNRYLAKSSDMVVMPYGEVNPYLINQLKNEGYRNIRTSNNIIILDGLDTSYFPIKAINLLTDMTEYEVISQLKKTLNESKTVLLILHKIGDEDDEFGMTYSNDKLKQIIKFINEHNNDFEVITYSQLF